MNFYPSEDDIQGHERVGDTIYLITAFLVCLAMMVPALGIAQCWEKVFSHQCFTQDVCDFQAQVTPEADYSFSQGYIWIHAKRCTNYNIIVGGTACDGVCDQGDFTTINFDSNCCTHHAYDTIQVCEYKEPYKVYSSNCQCDTSTLIQPILREDYTVHDTIPHLTDDITVDSLLTIYGCDSIIITHWIAVDFDQDDYIGIETHEESPGDTTHVPIVETHENNPIYDVLEVGDEVYFPNAFSPNGDGINDEWEPQGKNINYFIKIFDRWGNMVHKGTVPWNGRFRGELIRSGMMVYSAYIGADKEPRKGIIQIF